MTFDRDPDSLTDYLTLPVTCPGCRAELDGHLATVSGQSGPNDGSVSICMYCNTISIYVTINNQLQVRYPTDDELQRILKDPHVSQVIAAIRTAREHL